MFGIFQIEVPRDEMTSKLNKMLQLRNNEIQMEGINLSS